MARSLRLAWFLLLCCAGPAWAQTLTPTPTATPTQIATVTATRTVTPTPTISATATPIPIGPSIFAVRGTTGTNGTSPTYWSGTQHATEDRAFYVLPFDAVLKNMTIGCSGTLSAGAILHTWTLRVSGVDTTVSAVLLESGGQLIAQDWTHSSGTIPAGDEFSIKEVDSSVAGAILQCDVTFQVTTPSGAAYGGLIQIGGVGLSAPTDGSHCGPGSPNSSATDCASATIEEAAWVAPLAGHVVGIAVTTSDVVEPSKDETYTVQRGTCDVLDVTVTDGSDANYQNGSTGGPCDAFAAGDLLSVRFNRTGAVQDMYRRIVVVTDAAYGFPILGDTLTYSTDRNVAPLDGWATIGPLRRWRSPVTASIRFLRGDTKVDSPESVTWSACVANLGTGTPVCGPLTCTIVEANQTCAESGAVMFVPQGGVVHLRYDVAGTDGSGASGVAAAMAFGSPVPTTTPTSTPTGTTTPTPTRTATPTPTFTPSGTRSPTPTPTTTGLTPTPRRTCRHCANEHFGDPIPTPTPCAECAACPTTDSTCCLIDDTGTACTLGAGGEGCPSVAEDCFATVEHAIASCADLDALQCEIGVTGCAATTGDCTTVFEGRVTVILGVDYCAQRNCRCEELP